MEIEKYLEASKKVKIRVIGLGEIEYETERKDIDKAKAKEVFGSGEGEVVFKDTVIFKSTKKVTVTELKLFYGKKLVAMRQIPELKIEPLDTLEIVWTLKITRQQNMVIGFF